VLRGDRVGILGPNGAGKTSLLKLLLGELEPTAGEMDLGTGVQIAAFDQLRETLDPERSVRWNVAEGQEKVPTGGGPRHVISYLGDFLFSPDRCDQPVRSLSGGERNRLLLARLFTRPANLLVLDEPTNDLDLETLELLANLLAEFAGTVLLVSHDRRFLDDVVTSTLVLDGQGGVREFVGGYEDWERQSGGWAALAAAHTAAPQTAAPAPPRRPRRKADPPRRKLTWRERQELEVLPGQIEALEAEQASLHAQLADPALYRDRAGEVPALQQRLEDLGTTLERCYTRWTELEEVSSAD
jgi:ATP-binding cassette subfamily F protein uup